MTFKSELLPAPLGPMIARSSPDRTSRPTPESAATPPKERETSSTSRRTSPILPPRSMRLPGAPAQTELPRNAPDRSPEPVEFLLHLLVTAVQMVDAFDDRLAMRCQGRERQSRRGSQVACHHAGPHQADGPLDDRGSPVEADPRSHTLEFRHVVETILEDRLGDSRHALHARRQSHPLGLQVRGKAGVRSSRNVLPGEFLGRAHAQCVRALLDRKSTRLNSSHVAISYAVFCLK